MKFPNGPQTPAVVQMLRWIVNPMSFMEACAKTYGETFSIRLDKNYSPLVIFSNPQALQQILTNDTKELEAPGDLNRTFEFLLGLAFAQLEMKLALAQILSSLELELVDNGEVRPQRRGLVTGPDRPIEIVVKSQRRVKSSVLQTTSV